MQPAVFLDRDNTLIHNDGDLGDPNDVHLIEGVAGGLRALHDAGYRLVVVTNQGGVARGAYTEDDVDAVHQRMASMLNGEANGESLIDRFYYCPYHPEGKLDEYRREHPWRKPQPGMILQAASDLEIDLSRSWMVGNQGRDVEAGRAAGCRTALLTRDAKLAQSVSATVIVNTFPEAVEQILKDSSSKANSKRVKPPSGVSPEPWTKSQTDDRLGLQRAISDLAEEMRNIRMSRADFTASKMAAGFCQLLAVLFAVLGLVQMDELIVFARWMGGAVLMQLLTITLLILDMKG